MIYYLFVQPQMLLDGSEYFINQRIIKAGINQIKLRNINNDEYPIEIFGFIGVLNVAIILPMPHH